MKILIHHKKQYEELNYKEKYPGIDEDTITQMLRNGGRANLAVGGLQTWRWVKNFLNNREGVFEVKHMDLTIRLSNNGS